MKKLLAVLIISSLSGCASFMEGYNRQFVDISDSQRAMALHMLQNQQRPYQLQFHPMQIQRPTNTRCQWVGQQMNCTQY